VLTFPPIRLSNIICHNTASTEEFVFPADVIDQIVRSGVTNSLAGFEIIENKDVLDETTAFNFILSNGSRSTQDDYYDEYYDEEIETHMLPKDADKIIRSVNVYYQPGGCIAGFVFRDEDGKLLW
jgi:hypothetical protein